MSNGSHYDGKAQGFSRQELQAELREATRQMQDPLNGILRSVRPGNRKLTRSIEEATKILRYDLVSLINETCPEVISAPSQFARSQKIIDQQTERVTNLLRQAGDPGKQKTAVLGLLRNVKQWIAVRLNTVETSNDSTAESESDHGTDDDSEEVTDNADQSMHDIDGLLSDLGIDEKDQRKFVYDKCMTLVSSHFWAFLMEMSERAPFNTKDDVPPNLINAIHLLYVHLQDSLSVILQDSSQLRFDALKKQIIDSLSQEKVSISFLDTGTVAQFVHSVLIPTQNAISSQTYEEEFALWIFDLDSAVEDFSKAENVASILLMNKPKQKVEVPLDEREKTWLRSKMPLGKPDSIARMRKDRRQLRAYAERMEQEINDVALPRRNAEFLQQLMDEIIREESAVQTTEASPDSTSSVGVLKTTPNDAVDDSSEITSLGNVLIENFQRVHGSVSPRNIGRLLQSINDKLRSLGKQPRSMEWLRASIDAIQSEKQRAAMAETTEVIEEPSFAQSTGVHVHPMTYVTPQRIPEMIADENDLVDLEKVDELHSEAISDETGEHAAFETLPTMNVPAAVTDSSDLSSNIETPSNTVQQQATSMQSPEDAPTPNEKEIIRKMRGQVSNITPTLITHMLGAINIKRIRNKERVRDENWLRRVLGLEQIAETAPASGDIQIVEAVPEPLDELIDDLSSEWAAGDLLKAKCNALQIGEAVSALLERHGQHEGFDRERIGDLLIQSLEYHMCVSRFNQAMTKTSPNGWVIGAVRNSIYGGTLPPDAEGGRVIKDAVTWLLRELRNHSVTLSDYLEYRKRLSEPVLRSSHAISHHQPLKAHVEEEPEPDVDIPIIPAAVAEEEQSIPALPTDSASAIEEEPLAEYVQGESPSLVETEDKYVPTERPVDGASENLVSQRLQRWWEEFSLRIQAITLTPNIVEERLLELMDELEELENNLEIIRDETDDCSQDERDAVRFVQSAHLFSKHANADRDTSHIRLENFQPKVAVLQKHDERTKKMNALAEKMRETERVITEQKNVIGAARTKLNAMRDKDLSLPLDLLESNVSLQITTPTVLSDASEKLRDLQLDFESVWENHISIRTGEHPDDLPAGSIEDILTLATEAYIAFAQTKKPSRRAASTGRKTGAVHIKVSPDAFPALTPLQSKLLEVLTLQRPLSKRSTRDATWGHTIEKIQQYFNVAFPNEQTPTVREIAEALSPETGITMDLRDDKIGVPTSEMRQKPHPIIVWKKQQDESRINELYMATHMAFDWSALLAESSITEIGLGAIQRIFADEKKAKERYKKSTEKKKAK